MNSFFERIKYILRKEFIQIFRDRRMRAIIFIPPIIQLVVFGYAANTDVRHVSTAVYDGDKTHVSREFVERFDATDYFDVACYLTSPDEADALMDSGKVSCVIFIESGFAQHIASGDTSEVLIVIDGTDSSIASVVLGYVNRIVADYSTSILIRNVERYRGVLDEDTPPIIYSNLEMTERVWYNEELKSRNFFIPGILGLLLSLIGVMLTSMAIVKEREIGTMEQLIVTPIRSIELIIGKLLPFVLIGYIDVVLITAIAVLWFQVPFDGSFLFLFFATAFFLLPTLGVGLFISTISRTQQEAMMSTFLYFNPALLLSGFVFPIESMPGMIRALTVINPVRYMMSVLRGVFLKGTGMAELWPDLAALFLLGVLTVGLSSIRFTKRAK
ncbi:MAG: ABC transporter permease [Deltaproteobacteria bacterium]|nr:ABC transporter permease [Candidatus Zymogenaceae bacterium]